MTATRAYIIGAGASVAYGFPTLKTLSWEIAQSLKGKDRNAFLAAISECFGKELNGAEDSPDFEELLNRLNPRAVQCLENTPLDSPDSPRRRAADLSLAALRTYVQDKCARADLAKGPFGVLARALDEKSLVISFNWDVLLELAILRAGRTYCYLPDEHAPKDAVLILKPHGSINWFALLDREMLMIKPESNLWVVGRLSHYLCYVRNPLEDIDFSACSEAVKYSLSTVPAIVPPVASKTLSVGGIPRDGFVQGGHTQAIQAIWREVAHGLREATELIAIGYSLPGTDAASIEALKYFAATQTPQTPKRVFLVEPNRSVADRYRSLLALPVDILCPDFRAFEPAMLPR